MSTTPRKQLPSAENAVVRRQLKEQLSLLRMLRFEGVPLSLSAAEVA